MTKYKGIEKNNAISRLNHLARSLASLGAAPVLLAAYLLMSGTKTIEIYTEVFDVKTCVVFYCAAILAFLGGINWGFAIKELHKAEISSDSNIAILLLWSNFITIIGVVLALLHNFHIQAISFIILFILQLFVDLRLIPTKLPKWYKKLRKEATALICLGLVICAIY